MKHRVFIALPVSSEIKKNILLWQKMHSDLPLRWISPRNLHITLIPPWYTTDVKAVHKKLRAVPKQRPGTVYFKRIAVGPDNHSLRLIWIEGKRNTRLIALKHQLETILDRQPEKRAFLPHITVGRLKKGEKFQSKNISEKISWQLKITKFCLMESRLLRTGARYRIIKTYHLG